MTPTKIITFIQPRPLDGKRKDTGDEVGQHHHTGKIKRWFSQLRRQIVKSK